MKLTVISTGSKGNSYVLYNDREALMIEAGAPYKEVLRAVGPEVCSRLQGCIITHEHGDHAKYVNEVLDHAVPVYATEGTLEALATRSKVMHPKPFWNNYRSMDDYTRWSPCFVGGFSVLPFKTIHDSSDPCGFYIYHQSMGCLLFATDTMYVPARFKDLTNVMIECNYDEQLLRERTDIPENLKDRIRRNHQSVDKCIDSLVQNDLSLVNKIILIHISEKDGQPQAFKELVQLAVGNRHSVEIAEKGRTYEIGRAPF